MVEFYLLEFMIKWQVVKIDGANFIMKIKNYSQAMLRLNNSN